MAEPTTATVEGSTVLTAPVKEAPAPESKLFPDTPTGTEAPGAAAPKTEPAPAASTEPTTPETPKPATTTETKPADKDEKPGATTTQETPKPDYVLTLPEGSPLTPEELASTQKEAKEAGLPEAKAKEMLQSKDQTARAAQTRLVEQQQKAFDDTKTQWKEQLAKDPDMGGDKLAETTILASRAFQTLASPQLQVWAEKTGLGSYPEFVRLMARVGRLIGEDRLIRGSVDTPPAQKSREETLYGKTTPGADGKKAA